MKFIKSTAARYIAALSLVFSCQAFAASTDDLPAIPGINPPGNPAFVNDVMLGLSDWSGGYKLSASEIADDPMYFQIGSEEYEVEDGSYRLTAYFDWDGNLDTQKSNVQIRGNFSEDVLEELAGTSRQHELWGGNLFSARLGDVGLSFADGNLALGFSTTDFGGWASQFGTDESVWLYDFFPSPTKLVPFLVALSDGTLEASAVTTVPLPAGIWLIGSALMGYALVGRRRAGPAGFDSAMT
jgi:hypothetical protein